MEALVQTCSTAWRKAASLARSSSRMRAELAAASACLRAFSSAAFLLSGLLGSAAAQIVRFEQPQHGDRHGNLSWHLGLVLARPSRRHPVIISQYARAPPESLESRCTSALFLPYHPTVDSVFRPCVWQGEAGMRVRSSPNTGLCKLAVHKVGMPSHQRQVFPAARCGR